MYVAAVPLMSLSSRGPVRWEYALAGVCFCCLRASQGLHRLPHSINCRAQETLDLVKPANAMSWKPYLASPSKTLELRTLTQPCPMHTFWIPCFTVFVPIFSGHV